MNRPIKILKSKQELCKRWHTMYSKTKNNTSFSLITSFSFTIFGWFIFFSDWQEQTRKLFFIINVFQNINKKIKWLPPWLLSDLCILPMNNISSSFFLSQPDNAIDQVRINLNYLWILVPTVWGTRFIPGIDYLSKNESYHFTRLLA